MTGIVFAPLVPLPLIKFAKEYLADYKAPKRIRFVEDLKRNELGKVAASNLSAVKELT